VQVDPIKPTSNAPGTKRLKLEYDELLSSFAFKFNLRRYNKASPRIKPAPQFIMSRIMGRGLHSSTFQLNASAFCVIGVAFRGY